MKLWAFISYLWEAADILSLGHSYACYLRSCFSFSSYFFLFFLLSLSPFLRLCFCIILSFPPFFTSTLFLPFISCYLPFLIATLSTIYMTFKFTAFFPYFCIFKFYFLPSFLQFFSLFFMFFPFCAFLLSCLFLNLFLLFYPCLF